MNEPPDQTTWDQNTWDQNTWEKQIDALLDGELNHEQAQQMRKAAENDDELARAINEALQLRQLMAGIPFERAPKTLRRKLRRIPQQQRAHERPRLRQLRWGVVMATVLFAVTVTVSQMRPAEPTDGEIVRARQDLALAMRYLMKTSRQTRDEIESTIGAGFALPVTESTARIISDQFDLNKE